MNLKELLSQHKNILLVVPPIYDVRLPWSSWHQPTGLLQLAKFLIIQEKDVRLIDCLHFEYGKRLSRHKIGTEIIEGHKLDMWHFGLSFDELKLKVRKFLREGWEPDAIFCTTLNSVWWESARDTIVQIKKILPKAKFILGGAYPTVEREHALQFSGADEIISGNIHEAAKLSPELSLYPETPYSTGIYFYSVAPKIFHSSKSVHVRALSKVIKEIKEKAELGVREFVFFDEEIRKEDREVFAELLEKIADVNLDVHFVLPGNVSPRLITQDLAQKICKANVNQIYLRCDLDFSQDKISYTTSLSNYERCVKALVKKGGFSPRDGKLVAMFVVGLPYENLDEVYERLIQLAHVVGSVIPVPFQYVPGLHKGILFERALSQNISFTPEKLNSKLYPLARLSGRSLEEYIELTRLAALLNSKFRSKTFDFLGDSLASKMFRASIRTEGWNPFKEQSANKADETNSILFDLPVIGMEKSVK